MRSANPHPTAGHGKSAAYNPRTAPGAGVFIPPRRGHSAPPPTTGREILIRQAELGWGAKNIDQLSRDLRKSFPEMRGLSPRNLKYMRSFAEAWPDETIVQEVLAQITWYHNVALLEKVKEPNVRLWYARAAREHGWSRNALVMQIDKGLHARQGQAVTNFERTLPLPGSDLARQTLKDPYLFDFLELADEAQERELEPAMVRNIQDTLTEMGAGFAFVGRQVRASSSPSTRGS